MKFFLSIALSQALLAGCALSAPKPPPKTAASSEKPAPGQRMVIHTTAYSPYEKGGGGTCGAGGERLRFGGDVYSAGCDWSFMPVGTRFRVLQNGRVYVIEDYGPGAVGKKTVDLFTPTMALMRQWGSRDVEIEILEWGSREMSLRLLRPRQRAGYIRRMVLAIESQARNPG